MAKQKTLDYDPEEMKVDNPHFELPLLSDLLDSDFVINKVEIGNAPKGDYAVVTVNESEKYRTSSQVLLDQLVKISEAIEDGLFVRVRLEQVKNYYTFVKPGA